MRSPYHSPRSARRRPSSPSLPPSRGHATETDRSRQHTGHERHTTKSPRRLPTPAAPLPGVALPSVLSSAMLVLACCGTQAASARLPFQNCLSPSYIYTNVPADQVQLQFVPLVLDAKFETGDPSRNLQVTVWGNVTGRVGDGTLPAWDNTQAWENTSQALDGKIQNQPDLSVSKATTLSTEVDVVTYQPFSHDSYFCRELVNASCPLAPVFNHTPYHLPDEPYGLPAFQLSKNFDSNYAFTSFVPTLIIKYGDAAATPIGCISAVVTPSLGRIAWFLKFLPLLVLALVGFATAFSAIFSPWGTSDVFHWTSNYGRDPDLLRLVTPGFGDCLQYIQYIVLTGSLTLQYPGFYQPVVSQASWSTLMFNESFVSKEDPWHDLVDGIYYTKGAYGLERIAHLEGMAEVQDIWAGMMVWLLAIIGVVLVVSQIGFAVRWCLRFINQVTEEDLRSKNLPFTGGNVIRLVFGYFLLPIVALSTFQLVIAVRSSGVLVALAVVTLVLIFGFAFRLMYLIASTKPRSHLFDDLPTVLLYGPLYNTFSDEAAAFALIPIILVVLRGIAIGAVQPSGTAQIVILAVCEVVQMLTLHAFRPFHSATSMNAYHTGFAALRFVSILLMVAFVPTMGVTEGPKSWIGYAILLIHGCILVFGFLLNALMSIVEVIARLAGAGGDDIRGQTRGGLSKIFGARQLSRRVRVDRRGAPSRQSQLSTTAMLDYENASKRGYGRVRSESAGSMGILMSPHQRSSSALDALSIDASSIPMGAGGVYTPTTPRESSTVSFPGQATRPQQTKSDPFTRAPRPRRGTLEDVGSSTSPPRARGSFASMDLAAQRISQAGMDIDDVSDMTGPAAAPVQAAPNYAPVFQPRSDYTTREVDFYYGVRRGPALNSDAPARKFGTGPTDPTSPMSTAAGWLKGLFGAKTKEKGKGFEVVRSSRMPPAMKARGGDFSDEAPPEGIPVALGVLRNGPIESDDEDDRPVSKKTKRTSRDSAGGDLLNEAGEPRSEDEGDLGELGFPRVANDPPLLPDLDAGESFRVPSRIHSKASRHPSQRTARGPPGDDDVPDIPEVPRKSSKRNSSLEPLHGFISPTERSRSRSRTGPSTEESSANPGASSRLPFDRTNSQKRLSITSTTPTEDLSHLANADIGTEGADERPASFGYVHQRNISRIDPEQNVDLLGSAAEVVDDDTRKRSPAGSSVSRRS
ncbi:hypothetical protein GGR56DRAFT_222749 [Xylariaceae sp. FL0804]|nr:hypothetical protein GGR56DRAFT_222749 [Xylariaceae sp. FL0804]